MGRGADRRALRRAERRDAREARKQQRLDARGERLETRTSSREAKVAERASTKQAAYKAGMNPNQFVSDLTGLAGQGITAFSKSGREVGDGKGLFGNKKPKTSSTPLYIGIGAALLAVMYFVTKKK